MFPFKYKLTLIIGLVVLLLTGGIVMILLRNLDKNFSTRVNSELKRTGSLVETLMDIRYERLMDAGNLMADQELFRQILIDQTLDHITRDDIVENEVSGDFPDVDIIIVVNDSGQLVASNIRGAGMVDQLRSTEMFVYALGGAVSDGALYMDGVCMQVVGIPLFVGETMLGLVFVGMELDKVFVEEVRDMSGVDLCFLAQGNIFLSSLNSDRMENRDLITAFARQMHEHKDYGLVDAFTAPDKERFLYTVQPGSAVTFVPPYAIVKSQREDLDFIQNLAQTALIVGLGGFLLAVLMSFLFSLGITRPIEALSKALEKVDQGHFDQHIEINSRDEFSKLAGAYNSMVHGLAERERIRGVMHKIVSKEIAEEMLSGRVDLGGEERVGTVLFSDIRQFTTLSEGLAPTDLLGSLNQYFTSMSACIDFHGGVIDKYIGDSIMALFGLPFDRGGSAENAILAALDMEHALEELNKRDDRPFGRQVEMGIGINTGQVVAGNMGAEDRLNYSVLGDEVNLAARVEGLTAHYRARIVISGSTYDAINKDRFLKEGVFFRELDQVQVKGKTTGSRLVQVLAQGENLDVKLQQFDQARTTLLAGRFTQAVEAFERLHAEWPQDGPTRVFLDRAKRYAANPALFTQEYVNNIFVFTSK
jgi:adenylate cyclase